MDSRIGLRTLHKGELKIKTGLRTLRKDVSKIKEACAAREKAK